MNTNFDYLISPVKQERFFKDTFEKEHLLIKSDDPSKFNHILKEQDIDTILSSQKLTLPNARMANKYGDIEAHDLVLEETKILDITKVIELYAEGATLILSQLQDKVKTLKELCDTLSNDFGQRFQTNVYCTPGNASQGFNIHHDTHDVFILQICGKKKWKIYESPIDLAIKDQAFIPDEHMPGKIIDEFTVHPGDLLYIPRGLMHDAQTLDEKSIHITVGFMGYTWQDVLHDQINILAQTNKGLRKGFKANFWQNPEDYRAELDEIIDLLQKPSFLKCSLDQLYTKSVNRLSRQIQNPLKQAEGIANVDLETTLKLKKNSRILLDFEEDTTLVITIFNKEIRLPKEYGPVIQFIKDTPSFKVKEIPLLDDEGKVELSKTLVKNGCILIDI